MQRKENKNSSSPLGYLLVAGLGALVGYFANKALSE
jgi:hypothetical protein